MKKQFWTKERLLGAGLVGALVFGIMVGMLIQQMIMIEGIARVGESWEGVISEMNLEVDINETKLVQETAKLFPELNITERGNKTK